MLEGLLVFPIVLLAITALVEFGFAVFQWNQAVKAIQLGARLAAVSDPLATDLSALTADFGTNEGAPVPAAFITVSCGSGTTACDSARLDRLVFGSDGVCDSGFGTTLPGMCDFHPRIEPSNVLVSYHRAGLGYVGRPHGPIATITVELRGLQFQLPFLGALLGLNTISIPAHPVTTNSEDLCSRNSC